MLLHTCASGHEPVGRRAKVQQSALLVRAASIPGEIRQEEARAVGSELRASCASDSEAIAVRTAFASEEKVAEALTDMDTVYFSKN